MYYDKLPNIDEVKKIINSEEFKKYPKLFTSQVLSHTKINSIRDIINSEEFKILMDKVDKEYKTKEIYPLREDLFTAYKLTPYKNVKVVIIGFSCSKLFLCRQRFQIQM